MAVNVHRAERHSTDIAFRSAAAHSTEGDFPMLDILMVIIALAFFALSVGYVYACDRL